MQDYDEDEKVVRNDKIKKLHQNVLDVELGDELDIFVVRSDTNDMYTQD